MVILGGRNDIDAIMKKMENLQVTSGRQPREPSIGSEEITPVQETASQANEAYQQSQAGRVHDDVEEGDLC